jgi:hypothetical protein
MEQLQALESSTQLMRSLLVDAPQALLGFAFGR